MAEVESGDGGSETRLTTRGRGWIVAIGISAIVVSAFTVVLLPIVVSAIAAWWLATDTRSSGPRTPGALGKIALVTLALVWVATAWFVLALDAHFDCGGTLGGFGESANARLDDECYNRHLLRVLVAMPAVVIGATVAGVWVRRTARRRGDDSEAAGRVSPAAAASLAVGGCTMAWTALIVVLVVV